MPHAISDHTRPLLGPLWLLRCRASQPVVQAEALATSQENTKWRERHDDAGERSINGFVSVILAMLTHTAREPFLFTYYNHNTVRSVRRHSDTSACLLHPRTLSTLHPELRTPTNQNPTQESDPINPFLYVVHAHYIFSSNDPLNVLFIIMRSENRKP